MNYSVLVLGATISISLFIRICCSLEANLDHSESLFTGRAEELYEKYLKLSLLEGLDEKEHINVVEHVNQMLKEVKDFRDQIALERSKFSTIHSKPKTLSLLSNEELCGNVDPPNFEMRDCNDPNGCTCTGIGNIGMDNLPNGCTHDVNESTLACQNQQITNIPPLPLELNLLDLSQTQIQNISPGAFPNVSIRSIRLFKNAIDYIHPWAFHYVNDLKTLIIIGNKITHLAHEIYVGLDNTTFLDLQQNQISFEIYKDCEVLPLDKIRTVLPNLNVLRFSGNPLKTIPVQMFYGLRESPLKTLYIDNCYLQEIHEDAFKYFKRLEALNLSNNYGLSIMTNQEKIAKILEPLTALKSLYLSNTVLTSIPVVALSPVSEHIITLDLGHNQFYDLKYEDLSNFPNLEEFYLDNSMLQIIRHNAFANNQRLKVLSLEKNKLHQLSAAYPPSLVFLNISNVDLSLDRMDNAPIRFHNLSKLVHLSIAKIRLDAITRDTFAGLDVGKHLFIADCNITSIEDGSFRSLKQLELIRLENNPITKITSGTFEGLDKLISLNLVNCSLTFGSDIILESPFKSLSSLETLDLSKNDISYLPSYIFQNISRLCYVHLSYNPIQSWTTSLFPFRANAYDDRLSGCFFELYLRSGNIQSVTEAMLVDFSTITKIDLSNNILDCNHEGACKLQNMIREASLSLEWPFQVYKDSSSYQCKNEDGKLINLSNLSTEICARGQSNTPVSYPASNNAITIIISVTASLSLMIALVILLAYKNRAHLRYFWFTVKLNVGKASPRKTKLSTMEDPTFGPPTYEYDIFISYHRDDCQFIENVFLPEIEEKNNTCSSPVTEAMNTIYLIEDDEIIRKHNNNNNNAMNDRKNIPRFKVCLHERDFAAGIPITENIVESVDRSKKTLVFVSKNYMESQWCTYELNLVYHRLVESRRRAFVLVLMEEIPPEFRSKVLNYLMVSKTYLQWPGVNAPEDEKENFWKRLRGFLQSS